MFPQTQRSTKAQSNLTFDSQVLAQNLRLMGFKSDDPQQPKEELMFETSNHKGFQQVMYFLFSELDSDRAKNDFKNCYPAIDKKQEAEFRKKVATWIKELSRSNPGQCPHLNPSLLLSPGGRKFIDFLSHLITYIQGIILARKDTFYMKKCATKNRDAQRRWLKHIVLSTEENIKHAVKSEEKIKKTIDTSQDVAKQLSKKVFEMKARKSSLNRELEDRRQQIETKQKEWDENNGIEGGEASYDKLNQQYKQEFMKVQQEIFDLKAKATSSCELAEDVINTTDNSREKPSLDFTNIPPELVDVSDLMTTMSNLLEKGLDANVKCTDQGLQDLGVDLPVKDLKETIVKLMMKSKQLKELKVSVEGFHEELEISVDTLAKQSYSINWKTVFGPGLGLERGGGSPELVLLPPTPKDVISHQDKKSFQAGEENLKTPEVISRLKIVSPSFQTDSSLAKERSAGGPLLKVPDRSGFNSSLFCESPSFKMSRKVTPDNSPLLKATLERNLQRLSFSGLSEMKSLAESLKTLDRIESSQDDNNRDKHEVDVSVAGGVSDTKASVEDFSPALCSTMRTAEDMPVININKSIQNKDESSNLVFSKASSIGLEEAPVFISPTAADKIKKYRKFLLELDTNKDGNDSSKGCEEGVGNSEHPPKTLSQIWEQAVQVISPRSCSTSARVSRKSTTRLDAPVLVDLDISNLDNPNDNKENENSLPVVDSPDKMTLEEFMQRVTLTGDYDMNMDRILSEDLDDMLFMGDNQLC